MTSTKSQTAITKKRLYEICGPEVRHYYKIAERALCKTSEQFEAAFRGFNIRIVEGVNFAASPELNQAEITFAAKLTEKLGSRHLTIVEGRNLALQSLAKLVAKDEEMSEEAYAEKLAEELTELLNDRYLICAPCEMFEFVEGVEGLRSKHVSVLSAVEVAKQERIPKPGKNWSVQIGDPAWNVEPRGGEDFLINGMCWLIDTNTSGEGSYQRAKEVAEVFVSALRRRFERSDFCHRPRIGQQEAVPFAEVRQPRKFPAFGHYTRFGYMEHLGEYKVSKRLSDEFHSDTFQAKLNALFEAGEKSLAARVRNGLGWLTRGRQEGDTSERLLHFFTALEALLSEQGEGVPVSDSVARYCGVILAEEPVHRANIYVLVKRLYGLRSHVVHRGNRVAHLLDANNVQYVAERCFETVLASVDLSQRFSEFIGGLKDATHGSQWPQSLRVS